MKELTITLLETQSSIAITEKIICNNIYMYNMKMNLNQVIRQPCIGIVCTEKLEYSVYEICLMNTAVPCIRIVRTEKLEYSVYSI